MDFKSLIKNKNAKVAVIGLGYVGLPLSLSFLDQGYEVIGVDLNKTKIRSIQSGKSYITDISDKQLEKAIATKRFSVSSDFSQLKKANSISICVPTPLRKTKEPDMSFILSAAKEVSKNLKAGQLIVLESTTYPGTTREVVLPVLEKTGMKVGQDFFLAFSPERVDPGNEKYNLVNTPKVIGGITSNCSEMAVMLYGSVMKKVVPVSSTEAAEMVKLLENTFRAVNIGLVNEIAIMADRLKLDVWEVIDAAATKPFGFMPFYPGPGLGGHCIPVDPHYLSWKLRTLDYNPRFIELAQEINSKMPGLVVDKVATALNRVKKAINGSRVLILGVSYKKDVGDIRESPALDIISHLKERGADISYEDRFCPKLTHGGQVRMSERLDYAGLSKYDCTVLVTDHSYYDINRLVKFSSLIVDCRNATKSLNKSNDKVIKI